MSDLKTCVYSVLMGDYEPINEDVYSHDTEMKFICFTDNKNLRSKRWELRYVEPILPMDPIRSSRYIKILSHKFIKDYDRSIYIDQTVNFKLDPVKVADKFSNAKFGIAPHSFRKNVIEEFLEVARLGFDDQAVLFEQLNHYGLSKSDVLSERPYWAGFLVREHSDFEVQTVCDIWAAHVLRYSRRDQLSLNFAFKACDFSPDPIYIDNFNSDFHIWNSSNRDRNKGKRSTNLVAQSLINKIVSIDNKVNNDEAQICSEQTDSNGTSQFVSDLTLHHSNERELTTGKIVIESKFDEHRPSVQIAVDNVDGAGVKRRIVEDVVVARSLIGGSEIAERWFFAVDEGAMLPALILSRPNIHNETSLFLRWNNNGKSEISRIVLGDDENGFSILKVNRSP